MNVNMIVSATAVLVGLMVGLVFYLQSQSDDASYLVKSKWSVTTADGTAQTWLIDSESGAISIRSVEGTTASVQEFFGGKEYTYTTDHQLPATKSLEEETAEFCAPITHGEGDGDVDCGVYYKEHQSTLASLTETLTGAKHLCESEDSRPLSATTIGSDGNLSVGGFIVSMVNGSPSAILDQAGNSIATINSFEDVEEVKLTGCDTSEEATYLDAIANVADSRRKLGEVDAEVMKARRLVDAIIFADIADEDRNEAARHLYEDRTDGMGNGNTETGFECKSYYVPGGWRDTFQYEHFGSTKSLELNPYQNFGTASPISATVGPMGGAKFEKIKGTPLCQGKHNDPLHRNSKTNWCGSFSNREHTPCPKDGTWLFNPGKDNDPKTTHISPFDWLTDGACRRHDHGVRFDYIPSGCRLGCKIDWDLAIKSRHNLSVQSVFGEQGAAKVPRWGCYGVGYWQKWQQFGSMWTYQKQTVRKERILLGSTRYVVDSQSQHHYGYFIPFRYCHSDRVNPFLPNKAPTNTNGKDGKSPWWENDYDSTLFTNKPLSQTMTWDKFKGYWDGWEFNEDTTSLTGERPGRV